MTPLLALLEGLEKKVNKFLNEWFVVCPTHGTRMNGGFIPCSACYREARVRFENKEKEARINEIKEGVLRALKESDTKDEKGEV